MEISFFAKAVFVTFTFIWLLVIIVNKFYKSFASFILLLPFGYFLLGFMNSDHICNKEVEADVFAMTFVNTGILLSLPLIGLLNAKIDSEESECEMKRHKKNKLNHIIYLAMIFILLTYPHFWVCMEARHIVKIIRSCLETFGITLYIFVLTIIFME